jgi:hypothetical protein
MSLLPIPRYIAVKDTDGDWYCRDTLRNRYTARLLSEAQAQTCANISNDRVISDEVLELLARDTYKGPTVHKADLADQLFEARECIAALLAR